MPDDAPAGSDLSLERIELAARVIDPVFRNSPQYLDETLGAALGRRVVVKVETANPLRSFKGRGTDFLLGQLSSPGPVVCVSTGNFGQGIAYAARSRGIPATVFTPTGVSPSKLDRMRSFGASVVAVADPRSAAEEYVAADPARLLVTDGHDARIAEGAGTIAVELLAAHRPDAIVVPVGDGALITGIARWVKDVAPGTRIIGVCATAAPAMFHSWRAGHPVPTPSGTIAEGIAISHPIAESVTRMRTLVDDILLVDDAAMLAAMRLAATTLGLLLEPSGAAALAALTAHPVAADLVAVILTGSNLRAEHLDHLR
ncbi:threonine ammonia-lyase [Actinophytocola sp.]|uniref:threonine ammonia-lyase n=1 Tax=Actinophytocola sp. TaxID=1872138 RepID=UPI002D7F064B|nr:pyridoxal-phosphate dependent enzyme [Actinophytocola sp.]HET9141412.1 pyridoxal-phosphate dependent enzyme [Actinophytocola sp.]